MLKYAAGKLEIMHIIIVNLCNASIFDVLFIDFGKTLRHINEMPSIVWCYLMLASLHFKRTFASTYD